LLCYLFDFNIESIGLDGGGGYGGGYGQSNYGNQGGGWNQGGGYGMSEWLDVLS
jgi:hypothetical protein